LIVGRTEKANELALILAIVLRFYTALGQGGVSIHRPTHNTHGSTLGESKKNGSVENYLLLKDGEFEIFHSDVNRTSVMKKSSIDANTATPDALNLRRRHYAMPLVVRKIPTGPFVLTSDAKSHCAYRQKHIPKCRSYEETDCTRKLCPASTFVEMSSKTRRRH
jgi:hypothetical protein